MFILNLYLARPLEEDEAQEIVKLIKRTVPKLDLPFGSHCVHLCNVGSDTYPAFNLLSRAGANVSLIECISDYALVVGEASVSRKHKHLLNLP